MSRITTADERNGEKDIECFVAAAENALVYASCLGLMMYKGDVPPEFMMITSTFCDLIEEAYMAAGGTLTRDEIFDKALEFQKQFLTPEELAAYEAQKDISEPPC